MLSETVYCVRTARFFKIHGFACVSSDPKLKPGEWYHKSKPSKIVKPISDKGLTLF